MTNSNLESRRMKVGLDIEIVMEQSGALRMLKNLEIEICIFATLT